MVSSCFTWILLARFPPQHFYENLENLDTNAKGWSKQALHNNRTMALILWSKLSSRRSQMGTKGDRFQGLYCICWSFWVLETNVLQELWCWGMSAVLNSKVLPLRVPGKVKCQMERNEGSIHPRRRAEDGDASNCHPSPGILWRLLVGTISTELWREHISLN